MAAGLRRGGAQRGASKGRKGEAEGFVGRAGLEAVPLERKEAVRVFQEISPLGGELALNLWVEPEVLAWHSRGGGEY